MKFANLPFVQNILPPQLRVELAVANALRPYVPDGRLPGVRVFLGEAFRRPEEAPQRAARRWNRVVDECVRGIVVGGNLAPQAPPTDVFVLDTVDARLVDVQTFDPPSIERIPEQATTAVRAESPAPVARFHLVHDGERPMNQTLAVADGQTLGGPHADPFGVPLPAPTVSARHAAVSVNARDVAIADLSSRHGTWVRGQRIGRAPVTLRIGDEIRLAAARLEFLGIGAAHQTSRGS